MKSYSLTETTHLTRTLVLISNLLFCISNFTNADVPNTQDIVYVKGAYEAPGSPTPIPVIYDTFFPIIFDFHLPQWSTQELKIQFWKEHNNCSNSDSYTDGYPCPVMYYINELVESFVGNMTTWKNLFLDNMGKNEDGINPRLISRSSFPARDIEFYCTSILPHFNTFQTSPEQFEEYLRMLEMCWESKSTIKIISVNLTETSVKLEDLYHTTFASFAGDYWTLLTGKTREASMITTWTALQTTLMLHQYMETQKWSSAIQSCQKNLIPWSIISQEALREAIKKNATRTEMSALSISLDEMAKYFRVPLADCVFVNQDRLIVRILVPGNVIPDQYKIIKYEPVVFHEKGHFCWIDGLLNQNFMVDYREKIYPTDCSDKEEALCTTSDKFHSSQDKADPCVAALYNDSVNDIVEFCNLKCLPVSKSHHDYNYYDLSYQSEDSFIYAVADDKHKLTIECPGKPNQSLPKLDFGAYNISLGCGCKLVGTEGFDDLMDFPIQSPCGDQVMVQQIRPYHWINLTDDKIQSPEMAAQSPEADEGILMEKVDTRYGSLHVHQTILWILLIVLFAMVIGLSYVVFNLHQWRKSELFKENRLIYNVRDSVDNISLDRHHRF